jgi:hypothetical protein
MTTDELTAAFGGTTAARRGIGALLGGGEVSRSLWTLWRRLGIPLARQMEIQIASNGKFTAGERKPCK